MSRIILQPAGNGDAKEHFIDTIENSVSLDRIKPFVSEDILNKLKGLYKNNLVPVWGVTPGEKNINKGKWEKVLPGDIALFSRNKIIFASATVAFTIHNRELALDLWKTNPKGQTWEYIYFLDEVNNQNIPSSVFNNSADYKKNYVIQGFNVLDQEKSTKIMHLLNLQSEMYFPEVSREDYFRVIAEPAPDMPLDKAGQSKLRTEQSFLRNNLFKNNKTFKCGICGKEFPRNFLVAAHIKKRANCTDEERRDFDHIIMPMCKFGCDELYEKGYIAIDEGKVVISNSKYGTVPIDEYLKKVVGKSCNYWKPQTKKYFLWHKNLHIN